MALIDGLQAYWKFDESSGNAADSSGNSNTATNVNTTAYATGKINNAADLEAGSSNHFTVADSASVSVDDTWSLSFWLKPETLTNWQIPFRKRTGENGFGILIYSSGVVGVQSGAGSFGGADASGVVTAGAWYHIVIYYNGANTKYYLNGAAAETLNCPAITDDGGTLYIGRNSTASDQFYDGLIDEFGIWNRELTSTDVAALYNSGAGFAYPFVASFTPTMMII